MRISPLEEKYRRGWRIWKRIVFHSFGFAPIESPSVIHCPEFQSYTDHVHTCDMDVGPLKFNCNNMVEIKSGRVSSGRRKEW